MPVSPVRARCRRCREDFHLFELLEERTGRCPRCGWMLTRDWTHQLLEDAGRVDIAQRHLVAAARTLSGLPGNVVLRPESVLRNLFEEVGWERELLEDPALLRVELDALRALLDRWEAIAGLEPRAGAGVGWLRRALGRLSRRASPGDVGKPDGSVTQR